MLYLVKNTVFHAVSYCTFSQMNSLNYRKKKISFEQALLYTKLISDKLVVGENERKHLRNFHLHNSYKGEISSKRDEPAWHGSFNWFYNERYCILKLNTLIFGMREFGFVNPWSELVTEAVVRRCSVKKMSLKISQNSQKTAVPESLLFNKVTGLTSAVY